jgi:hypothetical protein
MEQDKIENFCTFAHIFLPLGQSTAWTFSLRGEIFKQTQKASVFDVGRFCFELAFDLLEVVEYLLGLL